MKLKLSCDTKVIAQGKFNLLFLKSEPATIKINQSEATHSQVIKFQHNFDIASSVKPYANI